MKDPRPPLSILEQARLLDRLVARCVTIDGDLAGRSTLGLSADDADDLHHLAIRLHRLAPYEDRIRKVVMGK